MQMPSVLSGATSTIPGVKSDMKHWSFTVIEEGKRPKIQVEYKWRDEDLLGGRDQLHGSRENEGNC